MITHHRMRFLLFASMITVTAVIAAIITSAQSSYTYVTSSGGVDASWRVKKPEYGNKKYEVLYKFVNRNSRGVEINYTANFRCGVAGRGEEDSGLVTLSAGATKSGELDGLYHYPCEDSSDPAEIFLKMSVKELGGSSNQSRDQCYEACAEEEVACDEKCGSNKACGDKCYEAGKACTDKCDKN